MKDNTILVLIALVFGLLASSLVTAQSFYKWVDENGVTHYGEERPADNIEHQTFNFPDQYAEPADPKDDYYSIQNQLDRTLARSEQIARQRPVRVVETAPVSNVEFVDNRGGFFVPNRPKFFSSFKNDRRFSGQQFQQRGGTRIGNQLRRQGVIPDNRQPRVRSGRQFNRQAGFQRSGLGSRIR